MTVESSPESQILESSENKIESTKFPIVGVAASAGGLEAFTQLLEHLPVDTGMAFVLIQHLSPDRHSLLTEILARVTQMRVREAKQGMSIEPNQVYVIPPNTKMWLDGGVLQLSPREKIAGKYMPGDAFFVSLAADREHKSIGVVMSGGDGDGSLGLTAIKAAGGVTFAQCENSAKFDSMPHTAVATGNVDFVLSPEQIAAQLVQISRNPLWTSPQPLIATDELVAAPTALATIFTLLKSTTGVDFSHYKPKTLDRRIQRRMLLCKLENLTEYAAYLQADPREIKALYEEILIHVTSFFRDPEAFELLKTKVFETITQQKSVELPIRIWVAGCSTGEEVYSIAICLLEFLAERVIQPPIQIFATDISELAIEKARSGVYTENQMGEVSTERRHRFFYPVEGGYHISKAVRELCVFARQDLSSDPPFSNVDLISCRNVLIYLGDALQQRIMPIFHYSLNTNGFLLLGTSESTGKSADLFTVIEKKQRIYQKNLMATQSTFLFNPSNYPAIKVVDPHEDRQSVPAAIQGLNLQEKVDRLIADRYTPVGVVVDDKMQVLQLRGEIDRYLKLVSGVANLNLFNLVRSGLLLELRAAIYQAEQSNSTVTKNGLRLEQSDRNNRFNLQVIPFDVPTVAERRFLILFEDAPIIAISNDGQIDPALAQGDLAQENSRLRQELTTAIQERAATQEYLRAVIQEQEYSNQDLKVANEEILSSNEELQSTNEELETAKEEIQATNEELNTTNDELRRRNAELDIVNNDLTNLLASMNIPILMLTNDLRIRRFTPMAQKLFNFIATDTGRPLSDIRTNLNIADLDALILEVLETLTLKELEVQTQTGYWYTLRIRPYRTIENQIDGVVLILIDIDTLKRSASIVEAGRNYAQAIVETVQIPLLVLEADFRVNTANRSFCETFQVSQRATANSTIFELGNGQWNIPGLRSILEDIFAKNTILTNLEVEHLFEHIGQKTMLLNALKIIAVGDTPRILLSIEDITVAKRAEVVRKQFETERARLLTLEQSARQAAEAANLAKDNFLSNLSHELRNPLTTIIGWAQLIQSNQLDQARIDHGLEVIYRSAKAQSQLIEDMLDLSRIASGKLQLNLVKLDLVCVVNSAIASVELAAKAKSIEISSSLTPATISGDIDRLGQVLWNLLANAIKFTPTGGWIEITLETIQTYAQIRVSDNGQGMGAELLRHVFDRFHQGDSSSSKSSHGLGLGLSIVQHIVQVHGGTVYAESAGEGQGTTMTIQLPMTSSLAPIISEPVHVPDREVTSLASLQILVVDDEPDILDLMKYILETAGATVTMTSSVKAAIAALRESDGKYDALLADIGMPEEDGFELIRQVRGLAAELGGQIPAAVITAYVSDRERQRAIDAGFQVHLAKPVNPAQLIQLVANLTGRVESP
jgi:two-component system, chemotaxis family, CheB/CheR fusion protein